MTMQALVVRTEDAHEEVVGHLSAELRHLDVQVDPPFPPGAPVVAVGADAQPDFVARLRAAGHRRVIAVTTTPAAPSGSLLGAGASDVIDLGDQTALAVAARIRRWQAVDAIVSSDLVRNNLVGASGRWLSALEQLAEIARFSSRSVLITGPSGTGKEMAARLVHTLDRRPHKGQLVILDCTTIVASLSGSELFGHAKGAFTGAASERAGAFKLADKGTLFLDEIGELPAPLQSELLRVIQEGTYKPVGSDRWEHTSFRLVCATNRDLVAMQAAEDFRVDLYHRITATSVRLPALDERIQDVPLLAEHFLRSELGDEGVGLSPQVQEYLVQRRYPGNVRDLKQLIGRMCCRHVGPGPLTVGDLPEDERPAETSAWRNHPQLIAAIDRAVASGASLRLVKEVVADLAVASALHHAGGNLALAARQLDVTDRALQLRRAATRAG
jgi:transcriptional regulator with GAF, ATPase, and Fis domain